MLHISGVGFATPKNQISNKLLTQLNPNFMLTHFEQDSGVKTRHSALTLNYLLETKNSDLTASLTNLEISDLELAAQAIHQAIKRAGIELSEIGLVIGETSTPFQTIPSQAQRVAGHLGMKVKAYDILAGAASPSLHISTLSAWREDRLPEYVLLIYSNLPTAFIDYSAVTPTTARFSDAAAAVVISSKRRGALNVISASSSTDVSTANNDGIEMVGPLRITSQTENIIESQLEVVGSNVLKQFPRGQKRNYFLSSQVSPNAINRLGEILGFAGDEVLISPYGDSFSSSAFGPLSDLWEHVSSGDRIYMVLCGLGLQFGHVVLEVA